MCLFLRWPSRPILASHRIQASWAFDLSTFLWKKFSGRCNLHLSEISLSYSHMEQKRKRNSISIQAYLPWIQLGCKYSISHWIQGWLWLSVISTVVKRHHGTSNNWVCFKTMKKPVYYLLYLSTRNSFLHAGLLFLLEQPLIDTCNCMQHRSELKFFLLTLSLLNAHWPAHQSQKSENWELEIKDRYLRSSYGLLVSSTLDDCLQRHIAQKIFKSNQSLSCQQWSPVIHHLFFKHPISLWLIWLQWLQTLVAINSIDSDIVSKLLDSAISVWSSCAVLFKSEQTPFPRTCHWFRSAALHRIQFGTCSKEWLIDWAKWWLLLWSTTFSL